MVRRAIYYAIFGPLFFSAPLPAAEQVAPDRTAYPLGTITVEDGEAAVLAAPDREL